MPPKVKIQSTTNFQKHLKMTTTRKRKNHAPKTSGADAASIPGNEAESVTVITTNEVEPSNAMTDVITTTKKDTINIATNSGTDTASGPGTEAVVILNTINVAVATGDATKEFISASEPVTNKATMNIELTITTNVDIVVDNDAESDPNITDTATTISKAITNVIINNGTMTSVVTATDNGILSSTNSITNAVIPDKTSGIKGSVDALVQVSVLFI
jgi:hypothetical protein